MISGVYSCRSITFGRSQSSTKQSIMYTYGLSSNDQKNGEKYEGVYYYDNNKFYRMNNDTYTCGDDARIIMGDRQTFGRVYIGSGGRGIYYSTLMN